MKLWEHHWTYWQRGGAGWGEGTWGKPNRTKQVASQWRITARFLKYSRCWAPFRVYFHVTYQACWWFPALFRLLIIAKLSVEILFASYRAKAQHREKLLGVVSPACFTPTVRSLATRPFCGKKKKHDSNTVFLLVQVIQKIASQSFSLTISLSLISLSSNSKASCWSQCWT